MARPFLQFNLHVPNHLFLLMQPGEIERRLREGVGKAFIRVDRVKFGPGGLRMDIKNQTGLGPWPALKEKYVAWKKSHGFATGIWTMTGRFLKAASKLESGAGKVMKIDQERLTYEVFFDDSIEYWKWVDEGTSRMPARPLVGWKLEDRAMTEKIANAELLAAYMAGGKALIDLRRGNLADVVFGGT